MSAKKPIRVFYSVLSQRFYATHRWKEVEHQGKRFIEVTGEKFDVTDDIAGPIRQHGIEFSVAEVAERLRESEATE